MNTVLKRMGIGLGLSGLAMGLFYTYMRLHDGPVEFVPWFTISVGGPFRSGELLASPDDWTFLKDREEIEMETLNLGTSKPSGRRAVKLVKSSGSVAAKSNASTMRR